MLFELPEHVERFRESVRSFVRERVAPGAAERDRERRWPAEQWAEIAARGWLGLVFPREFGGQGLDYLHYAVMIEEIAAADAALALDIGPQTSLAAGQIWIAGTDEQKRRWIPRLARGEAVGSWALTEPEAGSDAGAVSTRAEPDGDGGWRISGQKCFITLGNRADIQVLIASTDPAAGKDGLTAFVIERPTPGFESRPELPTLGMCSSDTARLTLRDVRVPRGHQLGRLGHGFRDAMRALDGGRIGVAAVATGIAAACLADSVRYASRRRQFGRPIGEHQSVGNMLADMAADVEAARMLTYRAAARRDRGAGTSKDSSLAKMFASRAATRAGDWAVQIHGGHGYTREHSVERYWRDAKLTEIGEGTTQIQQMIIARALLREAAGQG